MSILQAENISKAYGDKVLFENLTFGVDEGDKIAIIARNGTGKTTLLSVLAGTDTADSGKINRKRDLRVSYLEQNPKIPEHLSVIDVLFESKNEITEAISTYELCVEQSQKNPCAENQKKLEQAMLEMDALSAWEYEVKVKQILFQLDIKQLNQKVQELSGGQKKRLALAKVLIEEPELLLLDEPTNHLDTQMIEWLEEFLNRQRLTLIVVTHDRYFLDNVCSVIFEIENGKLYRYNGNYSYFLEKKAERKENEAAELERNRNLYRKELEWMRRMPQARTTKAKARIEAFYDLEKKSKGTIQEKNISLDVRISHLGKKIIELEHISKSYNGEVLFKNFHHIFKKGEKVGVVGRNGCGKSTLLDIIAGILPPDEGKVIYGETISLGYYKQNGLINKDDCKVIDVVKEIAEAIPLSNGSKLTASQMLNRFLFPPYKQNQLVSTLSGGEKRRLYLLTVLMQNPNFLILDEPTNDLDIDTLNVLEEFLAEFQGCVIVVTHDRYFLDKIADHLFVFRPNGELKDFYGTYTEYFLWEKKQEATIRKTLTTENTSNTEQQPKTKQRLSYKEEKERELLSQEIEELQQERNHLQHKLEAEQLHYEEVVKITNRLKEINELIEVKENRWLELELLAEELSKNKNK